MAENSESPKLPSRPLVEPVGELEDKTQTSDVEVLGPLVDKTQGKTQTRKDTTPTVPLKTKLTVTYDDGQVTVQTGVPDKSKQEVYVDERTSVQAKPLESTATTTRRGPSVTRLAPGGNRVAELLNKILEETTKPDLGSKTGTEGNSVKENLLRHSQSNIVKAKR